MSWDMIETAGLVMFALLGGIVTVDKAVKVVKGWFRPAGDVLDNHARMLSNDKERLDRHEHEIGDLRGGQRVLMQGVQALLEHELHNGNGEQMQSAANDLQKYLVNR